MTKRAGLTYGAILALALAAAAARPVQQGGKEDVRKALKDVDLVGTWIYDDIGAGYAEAKKSAKPMLVVFR